MSKLVSASLLSCDFTNIEKEVKKCEEKGVDWIHYDVMDGHFVDNLTIGFAIIGQSKAHHSLVNDVHIMIDNPLKYVKRFCEVADYLTFHYEVCQSDKEVFKIIDEIHECGKKAGLSINPHTPIEKVFPFLYSADLILVMSVQPGFGGQPFDVYAPEKIKKLREYIEANEIKHVLVSVDGGINDKTAPLVKEAGVDILVSGNYLFKAEDFEAAVNELKK